MKKLYMRKLSTEKLLFDELSKAFSSKNNLAWKIQKFESKTNFLKFFNLNLIFLRLENENFKHFSLNFKF